MSAFEDFWLAIGGRVKAVAPPPAERPIEMRRVLAARAFEHWRCGRLKIRYPDNGRDDAWLQEQHERAMAGLAQQQKAP